MLQPEHKGYILGGSRQKWLLSGTRWRDGSVAFQAVDKALYQGTENEGEPQDLKKDIWTSRNGGRGHSSGSMPTIPPTRLWRNLRMPRACPESPLEWVWKGLEWERCHGQARNSQWWERPRLETLETQYQPDRTLSAIRQSEAATSVLASGRQELPGYSASVTSSHLLLWGRVVCASQPEPSPLLLRPQV